MKDRLIGALRWSEKYTKTDMVYLASGGFWLTLEQVGLGLMALTVSVAFAHFISKEVYGTYRFLLSLFWTLSAFSLTGLASAMSRAVAKGEEGAYRQSIRYALLGALPMSIIALGMALYYLYGGNTILAGGAVVIAVIAPFFQAGYLFGGYLEAKRDFRRTAFFGTLLNLVPALLLLALMPFSTSPLPFFIAYLGGSAATAVLLSYAATRIHKPNRITSSELVNLSWHLSAVNVLGTIATQIDQLLVFHYLGAAELAIYSFATAVPEQFKSMVSNLTNIAFPKFVGRPIEEIQATLPYRTLLTTLVLAVSIIVYVLIAPLFYHFFFPSYSGAIGYSRLYAITLVFTSSLIPVTALQAHAAKRELYIFNIISALVQIVTLLFGIIWYGLIGLILARGAVRLFNLFLGTALLNSYAKRVKA